MLDIGWSEFLVIGVVALIVIGPRDLPIALRTAGRYVNRARAMAREFRDGLDDIAREADVKDIKNTISGNIGMGDTDDWFEAEESAQSAKTPEPVPSQPVGTVEAKPVETVEAKPHLTETELHDAAEQAAADAAAGEFGTKPKDAAT